MARFWEGSPGSATNFFALLRGHLVANGWTELDVLSSSDVVLAGEALDDDAGNRPFVRLNLVGSTIVYRGYSDWDPVAHVGMNEGGNPVTTASGTSIDLGSQVWMRANGYACAVVMRLGVGRPYAHYFGFLRRGLSPRKSGVALTTAALPAGSSVVPLAKYLTGRLTPGQVVWLVNYAHDASSPNASNAEKLTVASVGASSVTLAAPTTKAFDAAALLGVNPLPNGALARTVTGLSPFYACFDAEARNLGRDQQRNNVFYMSGNDAGAVNPSQYTGDYESFLTGSYAETPRGRPGFYYHFHGYAADGQQAVGDLMSDGVFDFVMVDDRQVSRQVIIGPKDTYSGAGWPISPQLFGTTFDSDGFVAPQEAVVVGGTRGILRWVDRRRDVPMRYRGLFAWGTDDRWRGRWR